MNPGLRCVVLKLLCGFGIASVAHAQYPPLGYQHAGSDPRQGMPQYRGAPTAPAAQLAQAPAGMFATQTTMNPEPMDLEERVKALEAALEEQRKQADEAKKKEEEAKEKEEEAESDDEPQWERIELDEEPKLKPRARVHFDQAAFDQSPQNKETLGDIQNGIYFRRIRLGADAKWYDIYAARLDFELGDQGRPTLFDAWMAIGEVPFFGTVRVGHQREPWSLEAQTTSNSYTFLERGLQDPFDPSRNAGIQFENHAFDESFTYHVGWFRETDNFGADISDEGDWAMSQRYTWLPWYDEPSDGRYLFHVGASHSWRDPDDDLVRYATRPTRLREDDVGGVPNFVDTGDIPANQVNLVGVEASMNYGAFNIQAEYVMSQVDQLAGPDLYFDGGYVQASCFLTGEHRTYDRQLGTWANQEVFSPVFCVDGRRGLCKSWGAWEVAARWSWIDLNDDNIQGGYLDASYLAVNWYFNKYMRLSANYVMLELDDPVEGQSTCNMFLSRFTVWF